MKEFKEAVEKFANDETLEVNVFTAKLEQKTRNKVKRELLQGMLDSLNAAFADSDVVITRIEKGIGIAFPTPHGYFPATIEITMKSTDIDLEGKAQEYAEKLVEREEKRIERAKLNAEKAERDAIKREQKRAERAAKEALKAQNGKSAKE